MVPLTYYTAGRSYSVLHRDSDLISNCTWILNLKGEAYLKPEGDACAPRRKWKEGYHEE